MAILQGVSRQPDAAGRSVPGAEEGAMEWREKAKTVRYTTVPQVTGLLKPCAIDERIALIRKRSAEIDVLDSPARQRPL